MLLSAAILAGAVIATLATLFQLAGKVGVFGYAFLGLGGPRLWLSTFAAIGLWLMWLWL